MSGASNTPQSVGPSDAELSFPFNPDAPHAQDALVARRPVQVYLIDVTGLAAEKLDALVPTLAKVMRERGLVPIFVTDLTDLEVFRRHGVICEALPPLAGSTALAPWFDWRARRAECFALILGKWRPVGRTTLGPDVEP
jgi:hypothetical protein